jgi:hypothetical protein
VARDGELKLQTSVAVLREANADFLDYLAAQFNDGRFRSAAAMLRGNRSGRRLSADNDALTYAERLLRLGIARSANDAARMAAKIYAPTHYHEAMQDRIRKKLRTKLVKSKDLTEPRG